MPNLRIIDKYCKKCNDNLWYVSPSTTKIMHCTPCNKKRVKKYHRTDGGKKALDRARKKQRENLTDNYIIQNLAINLYVTGGYRLDRKSVPQEIIEKSRQTILAKRELKQMKNENRQKA